MKKKAIVFGTGNLAEIAQFYLTNDSDYEVVAFTATRDVVKEECFNGRPLVAFDEVQKHFPPDTHEMFIAVGYIKMNRVREQFFHEAKAKGYKLLSYVSSKATHWGDTKIGENVFVFEDNTLQPFVTLEDNSILWSGNHIGHHSVIGPHCFLSSHVVISGFCKVGSRCFFGVNATVVDSVSIGDENLIGANALIQKSTGPREVYLGERTKKFKRESTMFFQ